MKILFLDVDGVLNSHKFLASAEAKQARSMKGVGSLGFWASQIDPRATARLHRVIEATRAVVVLSSSWRAMPREMLDSLFAQYGISLHDVTPELGEVLSSGLSTAVPRSAEIAAWLAANNHVETFAIVDDWDDADHEGRLVLTSFDEGLTDAKADELIAMLGRAA